MTAAWHAHGGSTDKQPTDVTSISTLSPWHAEGEDKKSDWTAGLKLSKAADLNVLPPPDCTQLFTRGNSSWSAFMPVLSGRLRTTLRTTKFINTVKLDWQPNPGTDGEELNEPPANGTGRQKETREREGEKRRLSVSQCVCDYTEQARSEDTAAVDEIGAQWQTVMTKPRGDLSHPGELMQRHSGWPANRPACTMNTYVRPDWLRRFPSRISLQFLWT